jgi:hypothetical protein
MMLGSLDKTASGSAKGLSSPTGPMMAFVGALAKGWSGDKTNLPTTTPNPNDTTKANVAPEATINRTSFPLFLKRA